MVNVQWSMFNGQCSMVNGLNFNIWNKSEINSKNSCFALFFFVPLQYRNESITNNHYHETHKEYSHSSQCLGRFIRTPPTPSSDALQPSKKCLLRGVRNYPNERSKASEGKVKRINKINYQINNQSLGQRPLATEGTQEPITIENWELRTENWEVWLDWVHKSNLKPQISNLKPIY